MDYLQLANTSALYAPLLQVPSEIVAFMEYLDTEVKPASFLEIGVCQGGTFFLWCFLARAGGIKLGIELKNGRWGAVGQTPSDQDYEQIKRRLQTIAPNTHLLYGDSHEKESVDWVSEKLGDNKLDFIFIDGDHSYEGGKKDYFDYLPFVKKGGLMVMHDIKKTEKHKELECMVHLFWEELEGEKREFIDGTQEWGGIGVIKV